MTKEQIVEEVEDGGFGAEVVSSIPVLEGGGKITGKGGKKGEEGKGDRKVKLRIDGMFCEYVNLFHRRLLFHIRYFQKLTFSS